MEKDIFKSTEGVLYNYSILKVEIANLELEIEELQDEYVGVGAISYEERTGQTNKIGDSIAAEVIQKDHMINKLERTKRSKTRLLKKIDNAIDGLEDEEKKFIQCRYTGKTKCSWLQVGEHLGLDPNYCCNVVRPKVINKLASLIYINF